MLLSTAHFPPIQYFSKIIDLDKFFLESKENYQKQSYRNRFIIYAANGPVSLYIPILKGRTPGQLITEMKIDSSTGWRKVHMKTIQSAYQHSPFYEFFIDDFKPFWEKDWKYLYDLNLEILHTLLDIMDLQIRIEETNVYDSSLDIGEIDLRSLIHPKVDWRNDSSFSPDPYTQNFFDKFGFQANLSIVDLIFQTGPDAVRIIKQSKKR